MATWLVIAAERRELDGILKRCGGAKSSFRDFLFACETEWRGDQWHLIANGPGPKSVERVLEHKFPVSGIISAGFCGALDPALKVGDIISSFADIYSMDRVAVTREEKHRLREQTGAAAVEMEAAAVAKRAAEWGVPFHCVRAVSDTAEEDMPLDFNRYRDADGRFSRTRIALAALARPSTRVPALLRLDRNCRIAAESLGEFFANSRF